MVIAKFRPFSMISSLLFLSQYLSKSIYLFGPTVKLSDRNSKELSIEQLSQTIFFSPLAINSQVFSPKIIIKISTSQEQKQLEHSL